MPWSAKRKRWSRSARSRKSSASFASTTVWSHPSFEIGSIRSSALPKSVRGCACTFCGAFAKMQNAGGWIRPLCDDHLISLKAGLRPDNIAEVARRRAARPEKPLWKPLGEFLDEFYDSPDVSMLEEEPSAPISLEEGAYLAASVEYLCGWYLLRPPSWVNERKYFLRTTYWHECYGLAMENVFLAESPTSFRRRFSSLRRAALLGARTVLATFRVRGAASTLRSLTRCRAQIATPKCSWYVPSDTPVAVPLCHRPRRLHTPPSAGLISPRPAC